MANKRDFEALCFSSNIARCGWYVAGNELPATSRLEHPSLNGTNCQQYCWQYARCGCPLSVGHRTKLRQILVLNSSQTCSLFLGN